VIKTESDFDRAVVSSAGAQGLMQLLPETGRQMGVTDPFDPRQNSWGRALSPGARPAVLPGRRQPRHDGARARDGLLAEEKVKIVAAYHAGPGAVERYGGIPRTRPRALMSRW
jgi:soluble lytic murein transglycosylase-like protein